MGKRGQNDWMWISSGEKSKQDSKQTWTARGDGKGEDDKGLTGFKSKMKE